MSDQGAQRAWTPERFFSELEHLARRARAGERDASTARAVLAALRRGVGKRPGELAEVDRVLQGRLWGASAEEETLAYLLAPLFALHARGGGDEAEPSQPPPNLGASLAVLRMRRKERGTATSQPLPAGQAERIDADQRRVMGLVESRRQQLPDHLQRAVALLRAEGIGIDWVRLWRDVREWEALDRSVQGRWARSYWRRERAAVAADGGGGTDEQDEDDAFDAFDVADDEANE